MEVLRAVCAHVLNTEIIFISTKSKVTEREEESGYVENLGVGWVGRV